MLFRQFFDTTSSTYTYLIADKKGSEANLNKKPIPTSNFTARQVGGGFISMGAFVLYSTLSKECNDCTTTSSSSWQIQKALNNLQKFSDEIKKSHKTGYILIFLGGLLILFDREDIGTSESVKPSTQNQSLNFNLPLCNNL